jgi:hypothetical protein
VGSWFQLIPVLSTKTIPASAARSWIGRRPAAGGRDSVSGAASAAEQRSCPLSQSVGHEFLDHPPQPQQHRPAVEAGAPTSRMKRKDATSLVESGCPVVTYWPGGLPEMTRVVWHDGEDARAAWESARGEVTSDTPPPPHSGAAVTAGRWESPGGEELLVLTWHH